MSSPKVLIPLAITTAMLTSSTVAEPAASETAWVSAGSYTAGDVRIRATTHRAYTAKSNHSGRTALPENDPVYWEDSGPTLRWAMFDTTVSSQTTATTSMTVVLQPGFFNAIALYKLTGSTVHVVVKDAPGGAVIFDQTYGLDGVYPDWYEWLFSPYSLTDKLLISGIVPYATAELTITVESGVGEPVGIGMVSVGDLRDLLPPNLDLAGGVECGASVEPMDTSLIKDDGFGNTKIIRRHAANNLRISVIVPRVDAAYVLAVMESARAVPAAWIGSDRAGYEPLNVFGLGSGRIVYDNNVICRLDLTVKGLV